MKAIFIAGTDTGVGKTVVTGLLRRHFSDKRHSVVIQKWIETGYISRNRLGPFNSLRRPYIFKFASSPHLAAKVEGRRIDIARIKNSLDILSKRFDFVIVEGIGGILVPIDDKTLLVDVVRSLGLPVVIVAANRLGAINHTFLTIEALKARRMKIVGIIFNEVSRNENRIILEDNPRIVGKLSGEEILGALPWTKSLRRLQSSFNSIGEKILAKL